MTVDELTIPEGLSARALGVYLYAYHLPDERAGRFTIGGLTEVFTEGRASIGAAVAELVEHGLARLVEYKGDRGMRRTVYLLDCHYGPSGIVVDEG